MLNEVKTLDPLETQVQNYCNDNLYPGWSKPFQVGEITPDEHAQQVRKYANVYVVRFSNVGEQDLSTIDRPWLTGLSEVGEQSGVELRLPYWYFET